MGLKNPVGNPQETKERVHIEQKAYKYDNPEFQQQ